MKPLARIAACAVLLSVFAAVAGEKTTLKAGAYDPPAMAPELALQASGGGALSLSRYRGRVVLLEFGYTSCASVCPTTLATLAQARKQLGAAAKQVQVVFVTVDPGRDTAKQLQAYLQAFDPGFVGGTGTEAQLAAVRKRYGVVATRQDFGNGYYAMAHSSSVYLIDRAGLLRGMMPFGRPASDYVHDLRALLAE